MAPLTAPVVALLMLAGVQADDMADRQGFLSQTSAGDYDKFITPNLKHMKHTGGLDAVSDRSTPAEHVPQEEKAAQKMLSNDSNMPVSLSGICIGLVSLATMLGLGLRGRIQRGLQSATILPGGDMSAPLAPGSFDNALELETQGSAISGTNILHGRSAMLAASSPGFVPYVFFINPLADEDTEMTLRELEIDFWDNMGEMWGYDIIGSESHPLKKAFKLYCEMKKYVSHTLT